MDAVRELFERLSIPWNTIEHEPLHTVDEGRAFCASLNIPPQKNLFMVDEQNQYWLICARGEGKVAVRALAREMGTREMRFASALELESILGLLPGSVTPLALGAASARGVRLVMDASLGEAPLLGFHPLRNTATTLITPHDFIRVLLEWGIKPDIRALPVK